MTVHGGRPKAPKMKHALILGAAALLPSGPSAAAPPDAPAAQEVSIPFVGRGAIRTFEAVSDDVVYIQHRNRSWYRAELFGPCFGIQHALAIGVRNRGVINTLERSADLIVDGQRCRVASLVRSGPPPKRERRRG